MKKKTYKIKANKCSKYKITNENVFYFFDLLQKRF